MTVAVVAPTSYLRTDLGDKKGNKEAVHKYRIKPSLLFSAHSIKMLIIEDVFKKLIFDVIPVSQMIYIMSTSIFGISNKSRIVLAIILVNFQNPKSFTRKKENSEMKRCEGCLGYLLTFCSPLLLLLLSIISFSQIHKFFIKVRLTEKVVFIKVRRKSFSTLSSKIRVDICLWRKT